MTAGKDRQKVPHWMGLPVKAAAGSSPADTSEILLKTATNMYLAGKNIGENLAVSKEVAILAVPRRRRFFESKTDIRFTADKAGFFFGRFLFGEVDVLADFQKSLASFVIYIQQIFVSIMPRRDKNLTADARIASASTPAARKTASGTSRLTKAELLDIIRNGHTGPPLTYDEFYRCAIATVSHWCVCVREGGFGCTSTDGIKSKLEVLQSIYRQR